MATLSIDQAPDPSFSGELSGTVDFSGDQSSGCEDYAVLPFIWTEFPGARGWPLGWKPATSNAIPLRDDNSWYIYVAPSQQCAAVLVSPDFSLTHDELAAPGTLPLHAIQDLQIAAPMKVVILTLPDDALTGLVTGFACALYAPELLSPDWPAAPEQLLKIVAWSRTSGKTRRIGEVRCAPSGYWVFPELDRAAREADEYFVALTASGFTPGDKLPAIGDDVWDMAWKWKRHVGPPLTRAAGQALRRP